MKQQLEELLLTKYSDILVNITITQCPHDSVHTTNSMCTSMMTMSNKYVKHTGLMKTFLKNGIQTSSKHCPNTAKIRVSHTHDMVNT
jgi:hypothetical protein